MTALKRVTTTSAQPPVEKKVHGDKIYELALALAKMEAKSEWPSARIFQAPPGQYFSLIVKQQNADSYHIAVKATDDPEPLVRLTDGEISYAETHAATYSLWDHRGRHRPSIRRPWRTAAEHQVRQERRTYPPLSRGGSSPVQNNANRSRAREPAT